MQPGSAKVLLNMKEDIAMADITLNTTWPPQINAARPAILDRLTQRVEVLRRRARRDRYLALMGRPPCRYPWLQTMFTSMGGR